MPFIIQPNLTKEAFRNVLDERSPKLADSIQKAKLTLKKEFLIDDYARIGSFLSSTGTFLEKLTCLETDLNLRLEQMATQTTREQLKADLETFNYQERTKMGVKPQQNTRNESILFKTHKLLSGTLKALEDQYGFNNVAN